MMKATLTLAVAVLTAGIVLAQDQPKVPPEVTGGDELVKEKSRQFDELWVHPDADITRYGGLYIWDPVFQFRDVSGSDVNTTTTMLSRGDQGPYAIDPDDQQTFSEIVTEVVAEELARSKRFDIVDTIGPDTLIVRGMVLDITSYVPPNVGRRGNVYLSSMGEAIFAFELIDAGTGVIQARTADRRLIQPRSQMNEVSRVPTTRATVWNNVEIWATEQVRTLRQQLDKAAKKK
jgi:hypothetical protein